MEDLIEKDHSTLIGRSNTESDESDIPKSTKSSSQIQDEDIACNPEEEREHKGEEIEAPVQNLSEKEDIIEIDNTIASEAAQITLARHVTKLKEEVDRLSRFIGHVKTDDEAIPGKLRATFSHISQLSEIPVNSPSVSVAGMKWEISINTEISDNKKYLVVFLERMPTSDAKACLVCYTIRLYSGGALSAEHKDRDKCLYNAGGNAWGKCFRNENLFKHCMPQDTMLVEIDFEVYPPCPIVDARPKRVEKPDIPVKTAPPVEANNDSASTVISDDESAKLLNDDKNSKSYDPEQCGCNVM